MKAAPIQSWIKPEGTDLGTFLPTGETRILPPRTLVTRSKSSSTQRKEPCRRLRIWEFTVWMYASQVFSVSSFSSAPSDAAGATRKLAHIRPTRNRWGIRNMQIPPRDRELCLRSFSLAPEGEVNAGDVLEVVLAGGVSNDVIRSKVGVQIIHFDRPDLDVLPDCPIQATTPLHGETVVTAAAVNQVALCLQNRAVSIGVRAAEQAFCERLQPARVFFDLGAEHVGEQVATSRPAKSKMLNLVLESAGSSIPHE